MLHDTPIGVRESQSNFAASATSQGPTQALLLSLSPTKDMGCRHRSAAAICVDVASDMQLTDRQAPSKPAKEASSVQPLPGDRNADMTVDENVLDQMQLAYKNALEAWIAAIRKEEALVSVATHSVAEVDKWEGAHFEEEDARNVAKTAKDAYEDALRKKFFNF